MSVSFVEIKYNFTCLSCLRLVLRLISVASLWTFGPDFCHELVVSYHAITVLIEFFCDSLRLCIGDEEAPALHEVPDLFSRDKAVLVKVTYLESLCGVEIRVSAEVLPKRFGSVLARQLCTHKVLERASSGMRKYIVFSIWVDRSV